MKPTLIVGTLAGSLSLAACTPSVVETPAGPPLPPGIESLEARDAAAPQVGDIFPDVTVVDAEGNPVNIRSLAGEKPHTVLTLGCLT